MRALVEAEGPIETSVVRPSGRGVTVSWKAALMVRELKKYNVKVAGISETKWFRQAVYEVEGYTILHSDHPLPEEAPLERNTRVAVVLDPTLATAWRDIGEVWKDVSPTIVSARLKLACQEVENKNRSIFVKIVSAYTGRHLRQRGVLC